MFSLSKKIVGLLLLTELVNAGPVFLDINAFYFSDSLVTASTTTSTETFYDFTFGFGVDSRGHFQVGWDYVGQSASSNSGTTTTYAATQMGPRFVYYLDRGRNFNFGLAYNLSTTATYNSGTPAAWKGTSIFADFGYVFRTSDNQGLGLRINYSSSTYVQQVVNSTTYTAVSYKRTLIYPSISYTYEFN